MPSTLHSCRLTLLSAIFFVGCNQKSDIEISTIYSSNQCNIELPELIAINNKKSLKDIIHKANKRFINETPPKLPVVNFDNEQIILISLGNKSQAGYEIIITNNETTKTESTLFLPITISKPDKLQIYAQLITSPCKIISIPKGDYNEVVINNNWKLDLNF